MGFLECSGVPVLYIGRKLLKVNALGATLFSVYAGLECVLVNLMLLVPLHLVFV
jgi:hypothetical protein